MENKRPSNKKTLRVILCSSLLWILMTMVYVFLCILAALLLVVSMKRRHKIVTLAGGGSFTFLAKYLCGVDYKVIGLNNIKKVTTTPAILASNHQSMWETMAFSAIFPQHVYVLKRELLHIPFFGWGILLLAPIAINRTQGAKSLNKVLTQGRDRFNRGFWILLFPQGTRIKPGVDSQYKLGAAKLAIGLEAEIVPVSHNAGYCMPKSSFFLYPGTITVTVSAPIKTKADMDPEQLMEKLKDTIESKIKVLHA